MNPRKSVRTALAVSGSAAALVGVSGVAADAAQQRSTSSQTVTHVSADAPAPHTKSADLHFPYYTPEAGNKAIGVLSYGVGKRRLSDGKYERKLVVRISALLTARRLEKDLTGDAMRPQKVTLYNSDTNAKISTSKPFKNVDFTNQLPLVYVNVVFPGPGKTLKAGNYVLVGTFEDLHGGTQNIDTKRFHVPALGIETVSAYEPWSTSSESSTDTPLPVPVAAPVRSSSDLGL